jgi:predicted nucleic acid-binding protein
VLSAATMGAPSLCTLDAIHLATAVTVDGELSAFVSDDKRLSDAAKEIGLTVEAPA